MQLLYVERLVEYCLIKKKIKIEYRSLKNYEQQLRQLCTKLEGVADITNTMLLNLCTTTINAKLTELIGQFESFTCGTNRLCTSTDITPCMTTPIILDITSQPPRQSPLQHHLSQMTTSDNLCVLCMQYPAELVSVKCGHIICCMNSETKCNEFYELGMDITCPYCRNKLDEMNPLMIFKRTNNDTCTKCSHNTSTNLLVCGHLGHCHSCPDSQFQMCRECNTQKQKLCTIFV